MSYQSERDQFIATLTRYDCPLSVIHAAWLRQATTLQRLAELSCSSEAADRDRIPCPATKGGPCLCDQYEGEGQHERISRIDLQSYQCEARADRAAPDGWHVLASGDPRGYVLRVIPPQWAERNAGKDRFNLESIGVPPRPCRLRF